jgi:hypothetical protein
MPTIKPRHTITETGPIAEWLARVRPLYGPDVPTTRILADCFVRGARHAVEEHRDDPAPGADDFSHVVGQWVALDRDRHLLMADPDPLELVRRLRAANIRPQGIMRIAEHSWQMEGMHGFG